MNKILVATGLPDLDKAISKIEGYDYIPISIGYKKDVFEACINFKPDILIVTEKLSGQEMLSGILVNLKQQIPTIRIVYLAGEVNLADVNKVTRLGAMVMAGIYDIITERVINRSLIEGVLINPRSRKDVEYLLRYFVEKRRDSESVIEYEDDVEEVVEEEAGYNNVFMVSSIKPGTGKSFVSTNLATAIAKYGVKKNGQPPRVAILEADLQTLSIGTLLSIEDDKHNLKTVMDKIASIVTEKGEIIDDDFKKNEVNEYILNSFKPYPKCKNLYALVGSQLTMDEIEGISPYYYAYLISVINKHFDVVIIDSNSSLHHVTTYPLLTMVHTCYYVLNLDYNNVRNNQRYRGTLKDLEIYDKVKFILNEDLTDYSGGAEKLEFSSSLLEESFVLEAKIPMIDKIVFMNRIWRGLPCVLDDTKHTLKARYELCKVANQIYPLDNLSWLEKEVKKLEDSKKKKGSFLSKIFKRR